MKKLSKREWVATAVAVAFITYMFFGNTVVGTFNEVMGSDQSASLNNASGLSIRSQDVVIGTGVSVESGMQVAVNYSLKLADGTVIQDSKMLNNGQPVNFIAGGESSWELGILGMKVGGKRLIIIPPELGYGAQQVGPIPPNSTLVFEIEVVSAAPVVQ